MDLRDGKITMGEILKKPKAKAVLRKYFPIIMNPFLLQAVNNMSLENTLKSAQGRFAKERVNKIISDLKAI